MATVPCPTPHKYSFLSKGAAKQFKKKYQKYFATIAHKIYIYHCPCGQHHFTKSARRHPGAKDAPTLKHEDAFRQYLKP